MNEPSATQRQRDRLLKIFEFLKAYVDLRYPPVCDIGQQMRVLWFKDLPSHSSIEVVAMHRNSEEASEDCDIVLRITRPNLTGCPAPAAILADWIKPGWQDVDATVDFHPTRNVPEKDGRARVVRFEESPQRPTVFRQWQKERAEWQTNERPARQSLALFQTIYEWFGIHEREAERIELLIADGLLNCPAGDGNFNHHVLLQRLELEFYPEKPNPQFIFRKREQPPELYLEFLRVIPEANHQQVAKCAEELKQTELSPLSGKDTEGFLRRLIQGVFPKGGQFLASNEQPKDRNPSIRLEPVIFMRQRRSGVGNVFDLVREDIATRTEFSTALLQIIGLADKAP